MCRTHGGWSRAICALVPILLFSSAKARAQYGDPAPPSTLTLDRMDAATRIGIQVGFDKLDRVNLGDGFIMRFEPHGQYLFPGRGIGIYGQLPIAHVFDFEGNDATGIGNLEAGTFFLPMHGSTLILRAGLALGTSPRSGNGAWANVFSGFERLTDFVQIAPKYTTLRLSGSTVQESGMAFLRIDLGLDLAVDRPSGGDRTFVHANIAGGLRTPTVDLSAELVNVGDLDESGGLSRQFMHTLAVGLRTHGPDQFYAGMVFPLDDDIRGEIWIVSAGYQRVVF